jgi:hypothetical protein
VTASQENTDPEYNNLTSPVRKKPKSTPNQYGKKVKPSTSTVLKKMDLGGQSQEVNPLEFEDIKRCCFPNWSSSILTNAFALTQISIDNGYPEVLKSILVSL